MNLSKSMNNTLNNVNNSVDKCVNNDIVSTIFIILVIFYAILIAPTLQLKTARIFDNIIIRILIITCIIGLGLFDPIKALLLAIAFVISIQRLYKLKIRESDTKNNTLINNNNIKALNNNMDIYGEEQDINILNDTDVNNIINVNNSVENNEKNEKNVNANNLNTRTMANNIGSLLNDTGMVGITNPRIIEPFQSTEDTNQINIIHHYHLILVINKIKI